jgi:hypothetical protein
MKAYFPEHHVKREKKKEAFTFLVKLLILSLLVAGFGFLYTKSFFKELDNNLFGLIHRSQSYSRVTPSSVIIVRYIEDPDEYNGEQDWPANGLIVEGLRKIAVANPKYFFGDYVTGDIDTTPEEKEALKVIAQKVPTAFATVAAFDTHNRKFKPVRFEPAPELRTIGGNYSYDSGADWATDFSFATDPRVSDPWFLDAWQKITASKLEDGIERSKIHFYGPPGTIESVTIRKLAALSDEKSTALLKGKAVFLGFQTLPWKTSERGGDVRTVVYQDAMADTEARATIAANLLDGSYFTLPSPFVEALIVYALLAVLFTEVVFNFGKNSLEFIVTFALLITLTEYLTMQEFSYWIPGISLVYLASLIALLINGCSVSAKTQINNSPDDYFDFGKCKF